VPWGIYSFLLDLPYDPIADAGTGRLETFRYTRAQLIERYGPLLTEAERRKAARVKGR
jgi:hypothetical protein